MIRLYRAREDPTVHKSWSRRSLRKAGRSERPSVCRSLGAVLAAVE